MAQKLSFSHHREGQLFVYHYKNISDSKLFEHAWPEKIDQNWWDSWDYIPFDQYNVCGYSPVHNAVYLAFAWKLMEGLNHFGIPRWARDEAAEVTKQSFDFVRWEYACFTKDVSIHDQGFVRARSDPGPIDYIDGKKKYLDKETFNRRNLAGLFSLETFDEFIGIQKPSLIDDRSETNYFGIEDQRRIAKLKRGLKSVFRPKLENLLDTKDIFINISVGLDKGYLDSVLIKTKQDISARLEALADEFYLASQQYEMRMSEVYAMSDFTKAIGDLLNL